MYIVDLPVRVEGHLSNSYLSNVKRALANKPQMYNDETFLVFGTELHSRDLEKKKLQILTDKEEALLKCMLDALKKYKPWQEIKKGGKIELELTPWLFGEAWLMYLDVLNLQTGGDLKSTKCKTFEEFLKACRNYDYFRQAKLYMLAAHLKDFVFYAPQKVEMEFDGKKWLPKKPIEVFELSVRDYPDLLEEGEQQLVSLVEVHKVWKQIKLAA
jgi:hypothetical protein